MTLPPPPPIRIFDPRVTTKLVKRDAAVSNRLPGPVLSLIQQLSVPNPSQLDDQHRHQTHATAKLVNFSEAPLHYPGQPYVHWPC